MTTCSLCVSNKFCATQGRAPSGVGLRCTREKGHTGMHAACGEQANEHPIFRWPLRPQYKLGRKRSS